jgi:hypothetical protein
MNAREKHQYLASRGLLLPNPQTIALTDQQREMLQSLDPQQRAAYIQKLQKEAQLRQQIMQQRQQMVVQQQQQQQQQQPNAPGMSPISPIGMQQTVPQQPQQMQWQQQQPQLQQQQTQQQQQQFVEQGVRVPLNGGPQQVTIS